MFSAFAENDVEHGDAAGDRIGYLFALTCVGREYPQFRERITERS